MLFFWIDFRFQLSTVVKEKVPLDGSVVIRCIFITNKFDKENPFVILIEN